MIPQDIREFIKSFSYGFLGTADLVGKPNISIKGIVDVDKDRLYFFDLFKAKTRKNLEKNSRISFFVIDWDNFIGYQLKGRAKIMDKGEVLEKYMNIWEKALNELKEHISVPTFETWFRKVELEKETANTVTLNAPSEFVKEWLETKYKSLIESTLSGLKNKDIKGYMLCLGFWLQP